MLLVDPSRINISSVFHIFLFPFSVYSSPINNYVKFISRNQRSRLLLLLYEYSRAHMDKINVFLDILREETG